MCLDQGRPLYQQVLLRYESVLEAMRSLSPAEVGGRLSIHLYFVTHRPDMAQWASAQTQATVVLNPQPELGQASSIRLLLEAAHQDEQKALAERGADEAVKESNLFDVFCVCDQPRLKPATVIGFLKTACLQKPALARLYAGEQPGNPCWFSAKYRPQLLALKGDQGGGRILRQAGEAVMAYPASPIELYDVDTQQAWDRLKEADGLML